MGFVVGSRKRWLLVPVLGAVLIGCDNNKADVEYLQEAKRYQDQGEFSKAGIELKNALQANPENLEARRLLGLLYLAVGNGEGAEKELRKAVDLKLSYQAVALQLLQAVYLQRDYRRMLQQIKMPDGLDRESQAEWYVLRGRARIEMGEFAEARKEFTTAVRVAPDSKQVMLGKALDAFFSKNYDGANKSLDAALKIDPNFAEALTLKGDVFRLQGALPDAESMYTAAIAARRINLVDVYKRARVRIDLKNLAGAESDLNALAGRVPNSSEVHFLKGIIGLNKGNAEVAEASLREANRLRPNDEEIQYFLAVALSLRNQPQQAKSILEALVVRDPNYYAAVLALAAIDIKEGEYSRAKEILSPFAAVRQKDVAFLTLYVDLLIRTESYSTALDSATKLVEADHGTTSSRVLLGGAFLGLNRYAEAVEQFDLALRAEPENNTVKGLKVKTLIAAGQLDQALIIAKAWSDTAKDDISALLAVAEIYKKIGDVESSREMYMAVLKLQKDNLIAMNGIAQLDMITKSDGYGLVGYESLWKANPGNADAALVLAADDFKQGKINTGIAKLEMAIDRNLDDLRPRIALAEHYLNSNRADKAIVVLRPAEYKFGNNVVWLNLMVAALFAEKNPDSAKIILEKLDKLPGNEGMEAYWWAQYYALKNEDSLAKSNLEKAYQITSDNLRIGIAYFRQLVLKNNYDEAVAVIDGLARKFPDESEVYAQRGWLMLVKKQYPQAISDLSVAYKKSPSQAVLIDLARATFFDGQKEKSIELINSGLSRFGNSAVLIRELSEMYVASGKPEEAIGVMRKAVDNGLRDPVIYNNLAWQLKSVEPAIARDYAEKAVQLAPLSAGIRETLGQILVEQKKYEQGLRTLTEAIQMSGGDIRIRLSYIDALIQASLIAQAKNEIKAVDMWVQKQDVNKSESVRVIAERLAELKRKADR